MPLYAYACPKHTTTVLECLRAYGDRDKDPPMCPVCARLGRQPMVRQLSAPHGIVRNPAVPRRRR
jgi:hypothetical protein